MKESQISILQDRQGCLVLVLKRSNNVSGYGAFITIHTFLKILIQINVNEKYSYIKQFQLDQIHKYYQSLIGIHL